MAMVIGGNSMPASIENYSAGYRFNPFPKLREDGQGNQIAIGYPEIIWTFEELTSSEFAWWATTVCAGLPSKLFTSAQLYNQLDVLTTYTNCIVYCPTYEGREFGRYLGVTVRIIQLY